MIFEFLDLVESFLNLEMLHSLCDPPKGFRGVLGFGVFFFGNFGGELVWNWFGVTSRCSELCAQGHC